MSEQVAALTVEHMAGERRGRFYYGNGLEDLAELEYSRHGDALVVYHVGVKGGLLHQGAGKRLVEAAVQYAHDNRLQLIPQCPFAKEEFKKAAARADARYEAVLTLHP
jgi:predicted GNAT family acetyltransferase